MVGTPERHYLRVTCLKCENTFKIAYESDNSTYAGLDNVRPKCPYCETQICLSSINVKKEDRITNDHIEKEYLKAMQKRLQRNTKSRERYRSIPDDERKAMKQKYNINIRTKRRANSKRPMVRSRLKDA